MYKTLVIAKRELTALFYSPIAYLVLGVFSFGVGMIFFWHFAPGQAATMRPVFDWLVMLLVLLMPAISMRIISEELASGTIEPLMTAPVSDTQVVLGKYLGTLGFLATLFVPLLVFIVVLEMTADPDWGPILTGLLGLSLVGAFYLAIGTFASSLTENQIIAFIVSIFIICVLTLVTLYLPRAAFLSPALREAIAYLNVNLRYENFSKGLIEMGALVFFLSGIALFLFLAVKLVESKRWR